MIYTQTFDLAVPSFFCLSNGQSECGKRVCIVRHFKCHCMLYVDNLLLSKCVLRFVAIQRKFIECYYDKVLPRVLNVIGFIRCSPELYLQSKLLYNILLHSNGGLLSANITRNYICIYLFYFRMNCVVSSFQALVCGVCGVCGVSYTPHTPKTPGVVSKSPLGIESTPNSKEHIMRSF